MRHAGGALLIALATLLSAAAAPAQTEVVFSQPPDPAGGLYKSAWFPPDGLDGDSYAYDSFVLPADRMITEIDWRGGYTNFLGGAGESPVYDFTVSIYGPGLVDSEPALNPTTEYSASGNAGEVPAGTFGGVPMYDYAFMLPAPFHAAAGIKYWVQIEASQGLTPFPAYWPPDWSLAVGSAGDGSHFQVTTGGTLGGGNARQILAHDLAFAVRARVLGTTPTATPTPTPSPTASATPAACAGDCNGDGHVVVGELITMVNILLGSRPMSACSAADLNHDGQMIVGEIVTAVHQALGGCSR